MNEFKSADYRQAGPQDADAAARLEPGLVSGTREDPFFQTAGALRVALAFGELICFIAEQAGRPAALLFLLRDKVQGLCKIHHLYVAPGAAGGENVSKELILFSLDRLKRSDPPPDVVYTTTRTFSLKQQEATLDIGFKMLGIFPNAPGGDGTGVSALTAYYFENVLDKKRYKPFPLHPALAPFYEIAAAEFGFEKMAAAPVPQSGGGGNKPQPPVLEPIRAARFVTGRFDLLRNKSGLAAGFYPFQKPNLLITNPEQTVEIFCRVVDRIGFAAIIGERIAGAADPARLYAEVAAILGSLGVSYVEIINDAADIWGVECLLKAGFFPCAYFPCLKKHGNLRRDYAVFSKSFGQVLAGPASAMTGPYARLLAACLALQKKSPPWQ
jgi:hypothetical protein